MDYTYVEYIDAGGGTFAPIVRTVELTHDNFMDVIWAPERGPYSEVIDDCLRRTEAGMKALRTELEYRLFHLDNNVQEKEKEHGPCQTGERTEEGSSDTDVCIHHAGEVGWAD